MSDYTTRKGTWYDHAIVFDAWANDNQIINEWRSRFDGVRERLEWAALDETKEGAHSSCALRWAVREEGYAERYPIGI